MDNKLLIADQYAIQIMNDVNSGIIVIDTYSRVIEINRMACSILGIKKEELYELGMIDAAMYSSATEDLDLMVGRQYH